MAAKETTDRRVYNLPNELVERIRAFQSSQGIANETEAVRRLLDAALQMRDGVPELLNKLGELYQQEKDLRVLARDVLASHARVKSVSFEEGAVEFAMVDGDSGRIERDGRLFRHGGGGYGNWDRYPPPKAAGSRPAHSAPAKTGGWDAGKKADMDDDIPF